MNNENLRPFDIEKAKAGAKVVTRDGREARIICFDRMASSYPIIALINQGGYETDNAYSVKGEHLIGKITDRDLFLATVRKKGWINVYPFGSVFLYNSKEDADYGAEESRIDCIEIEYNAE